MVNDKKEFLARVRAAFVLRKFNNDILLLLETIKEGEKHLLVSSKMENGYLSISKKNGKLIFSTKKQPKPKVKITIDEWGKINKTTLDQR